MKKILISLFISSVIFLNFTASRVFAKTLTSQNGNVSVAEDEIVDDDLFIGAQTINIEGIVNGDVFAGAQTVKITGTINGSLHVGANTIILSGKIKGNVYVGGQSILVTGGVVDGSLLAGGATVDVDKNSTIGGSIYAGAGTITIDTPVKRNVYAGAGSLAIGDNAKIGKDLYYATGDKIKANISQKASIAGVVHKTVVKTPEEKPKATKQQAVAAYSGFKFFSTIISFIAALIVGYIYLRFFGNDFAKTVEQVEKSFWKCFGIGFLVVICLVPGLIFLLITLIGIPLAGLVLLLFGLYSYLTKIVVGKILGNWLATKFNWKLTSFWTLVVGLGAFYILKLIPVIGFIAGLTVLWSGLGAYAIRFVAKK